MKYNDYEALMHKCIEDPNSIMKNMDAIREALKLDTALITELTTKNEQLTTDINGARAQMAQMFMTHGESNKDTGDKKDDPETEEISYSQLMKDQFNMEVSAE